MLVVQINAIAYGERMRLKMRAVVMVVKAVLVEVVEMVSEKR